MLHRELLRQDGPAQVCERETRSLQILAVAARVKGWQEAGAAHLTLQKNKQEPWSIASLDPEAPAPHSRLCAWDVYGEMAPARPQDEALAHSPPQPQPGSRTARGPQRA